MERQHQLGGEAVVEDVGALTGVQQVRTMADGYFMLRWYGQSDRERRPISALLLRYCF